MSAVTRFGQSVEADEVFGAWTSGSIPRMLRAVALPTNEVDRHHLLQSLVHALYKRRSGPAARSEMLRIGAMHLAEMPVLMEGLLRHARARSTLPPEEVGLPYIETFLLMVRVLCEDGRYEDAAHVWRRARQVDYIGDEGLAHELAGIERRRRKAQKQLAAAQVAPTPSNPV